ncbi:MAG: hypothetical protein HY577_01260 [Candidatus Nealsonbacteria bacterium]|nr:hypothetical protein [Candidatus Nealsonbacteria bacterium]
MRDYAPRLRAQRAGRQMMTGRVKIIGAVMMFFIALVASFMIVVVPANVILKGVLLLGFDGLVGWLIFCLAKS